MTITTSALEIVPPSADPATGRAPGLVSWYAESFSDHLGDRLLLFDNRGPGLELLRFHGELGSNPAFESALRARLEALSGFTHPAFVRPRTVTWFDDPYPRLALVSEVAEGERLSAILAAARHADARLGDGAALWLLRELLEAVAALHGTGAGVRHGLLTPERIVLAPGGRLTVTEYVLGGAVARLGGAIRPGVLDDVTQAARLGASVLLGRPVGADTAESVLRALDERGASDRQAAALRRWLGHALGSEAGFASATEARAALDDVLPDARVSWSQPLLAGEQASASAAAPAYDPDATIEYRLPDLPLSVPGGALPSAVKPGNVATATPRAALSKVAEWSSLISQWRASTTTVRRLWLACAALGAIAVIEAAGLAMLGPRRSPPPAAVSAPTRDAAVPAASTAPTAGPQTEANLPPAAPVPVASPRAAQSPSSPRAATSTRPSSPAGASGTDSVIGWISIQTPFEVRVYANGRLLGSGFSQRYRLPEGRHIITVASDEHGIRSTQTIDVEPGRTVSVAVDTPSN